VDINRYAYAGNDPVNGSDPGGHRDDGPDSPAGIVGAALADLLRPYMPGNLDEAADQLDEFGNSQLGNPVIGPEEYLAAKTAAIGTKGLSASYKYLGVMYRTLQEANRARNIERVARAAFRSDLVNAGKLVGEQAAHHIVELNNVRAVDVLKKWGVSVDDIANGVGIWNHARPGFPNCGRHCAVYGEAVYDIVRGSKSKQDLLDRLKKIENQLKYNDDAGKKVDDWANEYLSGKG
jgi:hypothetical protein